MTYPYAAVKYQGKKRDVHRLMMEQHLGRKLKRNEVVHHKDEDKKHNVVENFKVLPLSRHSRDHGRKIRSFAKLTPADVRAIRKLFRNKELSNRAIGKMFGVAKETIRDIRARRHWGWVTKNTES